MVYCTGCGMTKAGMESATDHLGVTWTKFDGACCDGLPFIPVVGRTADGKTVWYTGKAGSEFVSSDPKAAFKGYSVDNARRRALQLNRMTPMHGIYFVACTGDMAEECR